MEVDDFKEMDMTRLELAVQWSSVRCPGKIWWRLTAAKWGISLDIGKPPAIRAVNTVFIKSGLYKPLTRNKNDS